jgi:hypothetical protein
MGMGMDKDKQRATKSQDEKGAHCTLHTAGDHS